MPYVWRTTDGDVCAVFEQDPGGLESLVDSDPALVKFLAGERPKPDTPSPSPHPVSDSVDLTIRDDAARADGYVWRQNVGYKLTAKANGIYFSNVLNATVEGSPTGASQVWSNLDRMFVSTKPDASGAVVVRYLQAVRYQPAAALTMWAGVAEARDMTGLPSSKGGPILALEVDLAANGDDDANARQGVVITLLDGTHGQKGGHPNARRALGVFNGGMSDAYFHSVLDIGTPFRDAVLDTRHAGDAKDGSGNAIWMRDTQAIAFDGAGNMRVRWDPSVNKLVIEWDGKPVWSIDPSGNTWQSGVKS